MKTTTPACDKTYRQSYLRLILKKLKECKTSTNDQLTFTLQEKQIIEYHLKDVARESVLADTSTEKTEECAGVFIARIDRLASGENREWERIRELIQSNARVLTPEEIIEFDNLSRHFHRLNSKQHSEF